MNVRLAQNLKMRDLQKEFRLFLELENFTASTINTVCYDSFYLWRQGGRTQFWSVVTSSDFTKRAKKELRRLLEQHSKGDVERNVNGYVKNLRRFREFVFDIPRPNGDELERYIEQWKGMDDYQNQEDALDKLFGLCPHNTDIKDVLLKSTVLNDFYSTRIIDINPVAEKILGLDVDRRLDDGDLTLVDDMGTVKRADDKEVSVYSFASKYCSHHKPDLYPIYDSFVEKMLCFFQQRDEFHSFKRNELRQYPRFHEVMVAFREYYGLTKYSFKLVDKFLWLLGKDYFPKKYKSDPDER